MIHIPAKRWLTSVPQKSWPRQELEAAYGQVWDAQELKRDFDVQGFVTPFCVVQRKSDGAVGSLLYQNNPTLYYDFSEIED